MVQTIFLSALVMFFWNMPTFAMTWQDLWWRKDQQAMSLLKEGKPQQAAATFESSSWKAVANYRAKNYLLSEKNLQHSPDATSKYNLGNARALQGKYQAAINAYDQAIKLQADFKDAIYNRDLIKKMLEQQKNKKPDQQQQNSKDNQQKNNQQQKSQNNNESNSQKPDNKDNKDNKEKKENNKENKPDPTGNNKDQPQPSGSKQEPSADQNKNSDKDNQQQQNQPQKPDEKQPNKQESKSADKTDKQSSQQQQQQSAATEKKSAEEKKLGLKKQKLDQETDQWLQQIADDPGDLLRRKIMRDHLKKNQGRFSFND